MNIPAPKILFLVVSGLLALSLIANFWYAGIEIPRMNSDIRNLTEETSALTDQKNSCNASLAAADQSISQYTRDIGRYADEVGNLSTRLNTTSGAYLGSASMEAPVVFQMVDRNGQESDNTTGGMILVSAEMRYGQGRVLVETHPPLGVTFQETAGDAVTAAKKLTGKNLSNEDVVFTVKAAKQPLSVDGPSAGALMGYLAFAVMNGTPVNTSIAITGSIDEKGHIGSIGGLPEKAQAAANANKTLLLIPRENQYLTVVHITGSSRVAETVDAKTFIEKQVKIRCEYIDSLSDISQYMM